jgi:hypothetical protein
LFCFFLLLRLLASFVIVFFIYFYFLFFGDSGYEMVVGFLLLPSSPSATSFSVVDRNVVVGEMGEMVQLRKRRRRRRGHLSLLTCVVGFLFLCQVSRLAAAAVLHRHQRISGM